MRIELNGTDLLGRKLAKVVSKRGQRAAAKGVATLIRNRMITDTIPATTGIKTGRLRNPENWKVRGFQTPVPGAEFGTSLPYAARLNYSSRKGPPRKFLEKAVLRTRNRWQAVAAAAWRRERAR